MYMYVMMYTALSSIIHYGHFVSDVWNKRLSEEHIRGCSIHQPAVTPDALICTHECSFLILVNVKSMPTMVHFKTKCMILLVCNNILMSSSSTVLVLQVRHIIHGVGCSCLNQK